MLRSVRSQLPGSGATITVVDNGSRDETAAIAASEDGVELLRQGNTGFAHGVNRGIERSPSGHDVVVLNADLRVEDGCIEALTAVLDEVPDAAVVVPRVVDEAGRVLPSLRREPSIGRTLVEAVVGGRRAGPLGEAHRPGSGRAVTTWATGAAMLLRREAIEAVGLLDERFFLYSEETEYCLRLRDAGYLVLVEPRASVLHYGGEMGTRPTLWALRAVNRVRLHRRRHGAVSAFAFRLASLLFELRRAVTGDRVSRAAVRALVVPDLERAAARLVGELGGEVEVVTRPGGPRSGG